MSEVRIIVRTPRIDALRKKLADLTPLNKAIGDEIMYEIKQNFADEGKWEKWAPLARTTVYKRNALGLGHKILDVSGKMKSSFRVSASKTRVMVYSDDKIAALHHEGRSGKSWVIAAKHKSHLFFPHPGGNVPYKGYMWAKTYAVVHKGFPARPLLPPEHVAKKIARDVADDYLGY